MDTVGVNDRSWLDQVGHVHTDKLHFVERYKRIGVDVLEIDMTIDDPGAYTKPFAGHRNLLRSTTGFMRYQWVCSVRDTYDHYAKVGQDGNSGETTFK